jgi:hypothetical protein
MPHLALPTANGALLAALAPVLVLLLGLVGYGLVDLVRRPAAPYLPKLAWVPIILLVVPRPRCRGGTADAGRHRAR